MAKNKVLICPYCGDTQPAGERCRACSGLFEPLSRQATHNAMGPWFVRDDARPFQPGCSYETLIKLIERGQVTKYSIIRGPTTKQFWTIAKRVPGLSHLLGYCHNCDASVDSSDHGCHACGVPFGAYLDRNFLGLPDVRPLPWEAGVDERGTQSQGASRMIDFRRAAEPLGISSFASDEELRSNELPPATAYPRPIPRPVSTGGFNPHTMQLGEPGLQTATMSAVTPAVHSQPEFHPSSLAVLETSPAGAAMRSMQRRVDQQQRTVRVLAVLLLVMAVVTVVMAAVLIARSTTPQLAPAMTGNAVVPAPSSKSTVPPAKIESTAGKSVPTAEAGATQNDTDAAKAVLESQFKSASDLVAEARNADRVAADRIHDYEQAIAMLKSIDSKAPADQKPEGLTELLKQVERELERLKLQEFFP